MNYIYLPTSNPRSAKGLTLVELMVAVVVSLILFLGISQIFVSNKRAYRAQDDNSHIQENGRFATGILMQDLRRAGYYGGNANVEDITGSLGVVAPTNTCPTNNTWARMLEWPIVGNDNTNANYACIPNGDYQGGTDIVVMRYTRGNNIDNATMIANPTQLYVRSSLFEGRLFAGADAAANNVAETPNTAQELVSYAYYVGPTGRVCTDGSPILAMFRESLDANGLPNREEIATNVENLQIQYGLDNNDDLITDQYVDAGAVADWTRVNSVRLWVLVRSECPVPGFTNVNRPNFVMGNVVVNPNGDRYKRQLYTGTVSMRN